MSDQIEIDGKKYKLVPIEEENNVLDDYRVKKNVLESNTEPQPGKTVTKAKSSNSGVKKAEPGIYEYREKFKSKTLSPADFSKPKRRSKKLKQPNIKDYGLLTEGRGVEYDYF